MLRKGIRTQLGLEPLASGTMVLAKALNSAMPSQEHWEIDLEVLLNTLLVIIDEDVIAEPLNH